MKVNPIGGFRLDEFTVDVEFRGGGLAHELGQELSVGPLQGRAQAFLVHFCGRSKFQGATV